MYIDKMYEFSDTESFASFSATNEQVSQNIVYLGALETDAFGTTILPNIGDGGELVWHVLVSALFVGGGATVVAELITKSTSSTMQSSGTVIDTFIIPEAATIGTHFQRPVPMNQMAAGDKYMAVLYRGAGAQTTAGTVDSWISMDRNLTDSGFGARQT